MQVRLFVIAISSLFASLGTAAAIDCDPLQPSVPQDQSVEFEGAVNARVSGVLAKITGAQADLEGAYTEILTDVLSDYPNADKLFIYGQSSFTFVVSLSRALDNPMLRRTIS